MICREKIFLSTRIPKSNYSIRSLKTPVNEIVMGGRVMGWEEGEFLFITHNPEPITI